MFILSGIIAAVFAYLLNKAIINRFGGAGLVTFVPFIEEFLKTFTAVMMKTNVLAVHVVFGVIEGCYDIVTSPKKIGKLAALASIFSHSLFGYITIITYGHSKSIILGILTAWVFHSGWNWYVTKYL